MDFPGARGSARRDVLSRIVQLGRRRSAERADAETAVPGQEQRIRALEQRIDHLEALLEGLQDAIHRDSVRHSGRIGELERRVEPAEMSRALSRDARQRGV